MSSEELEQRVWEIRKKLYLGEKLTEQEEIIAAYEIWGFGCGSCYV